MLFIFSVPILFLLLLLLFLLLILFICKLFQIALQSVGVFQFGHWFGPDFNLGLVKAESDGFVVIILGYEEFLFLGFNLLHHELQVIWVYLIIIFLLDQSEGHINPALVFLYGFHLFGHELFAFKEGALLEVPILLPPLSTLVEHSYLGRVSQVHLAITIGHLPHGLPGEVSPPSPVTRSDGHPQLLILFLLQISDRHQLYYYYRLRLCYELINIVSSWNDLIQYSRLYDIIYYLCCQYVQFIMLCYLN